MSVDQEEKIEGNNKIRRRTKSVTRAEEIKTIEARLRKSQPDKPLVFAFLYGKCQ